jgi:hypothetical protein
MGEGNLTARGWSPATIDVVKFGVAMAVAEERKDHAHHSYEITARTTFVFALLR